MKVELELNFPDDRVFLNFWNWYNGDDVCCQVLDGKLFLTEYNEKGEENEKEITLLDFISMVKERMDLITSKYPEE